MRRPLPLTWPDQPRADGVDVALGCSGGTMLRYELRHKDRGAWVLTVEANQALRTLEFKTQREAKSYARRDFSRRQLVRRVA